MSSKNDKIIEDNIVEEKVEEKMEDVVTEISNEEVTNVAIPLFSIENYSTDLSKFLNEFESDFVAYINQMRAAHPDVLVDLNFLGKKATLIINEYSLLNKLNYDFSATVNIDDKSNLKINLLPMNKESFDALCSITDMDTYEWDEESNSMLQSPNSMVILSRKEFDKLVEIIGESPKDDPRNIIVRLINKKSGLLKQAIHGNIKYDIKEV